MSIAAHALGGGTVAPQSSALMLLVAACTVIGVLAAHTRAGLPRLMLLLAAGQTSGHLALSMSPHCHESMVCAPMLLAHLVAILVGALLIRGAETTLLRAVSRIRWAVRAICAALGITPAPGLVTARDIASPPRLLILASGTGRRGPPLVAESFPVPHPVPA